MSLAWPLECFNCSSSTKTQQIKRSHKLMSHQQCLAYLCCHNCISMEHQEVVFIRILFFLLFDEGLRASSHKLNVVNQVIACRKNEKDHVIFSELYISFTESKPDLTPPMSGKNIHGYIHLLPKSSYLSQVGTRKDPPPHHLVW